MCFSITAVLHRIEQLNGFPYWRRWKSNTSHLLQALQEVTLIPEPWLAASPNWLRGRTEMASRILESGLGLDDGPVHLDSLVHQQGI